MIPIQNIYYMLAYAFRALERQEIKSLATENFANTADLLAAILVQGFSLQIKRGLYHEYVERTEASTCPHGRLEITASLQSQNLARHAIVCVHDDFSPNNYLNQIIKTALQLLLAADINIMRKRKIRKLLLFLSEVEALPPKQIDWQIRYQNNNQSYQILINVCELVILGLLPRGAHGSTKLMDFLDDRQMSRLYEKFLLEYYRKELSQARVRAAQIPWAVDSTDTALLPVMQSDITIEQGNKILIIDAKYYAHTLQSQFGAHSLHSGNLYQIFTYVKNEQATAGKNKEVSGMLLYARTTEELQPNFEQRIDGNLICVRTLDLNCPFAQVRKQLNEITERYLGIDTKVGE